MAEHDDMYYGGVQGLIEFTGQEEASKISSGKKYIAFKNESFEGFRKLDMCEIRKGDVLVLDNLIIDGTEPGKVFCDIPLDVDYKDCWLLLKYSMQEIINLSHALSI